MTEYEGAIRRLELEKAELVRRVAYLEGVLWPTLVSDRARSAPSHVSPASVRGSDCPCGALGKSKKSQRERVQEYRPDTSSVPADRTLPDLD